MVSISFCVSLLSLNLRHIGLAYSNEDPRWTCKDVTDIPFIGYLINLGKLEGQTTVSLNAGVITIGGAGMMNCQQQYGKFPWKEEPYWSTIKSVTATGAFVTIESDSFRDCATLETVDLSGASDLLVIDLKAFYNCTNLRSVTLCGTLEGIAEFAFSQCVSLEHVHLVESDSLIGLCESAFSECHSLTEFAVPRKNVYVGNGCFSGCGSLASFTYSGDGKSKASTLSSLAQTAQAILQAFGMDLSALGIRVVNLMDIVSNNQGVFCNHSFYRCGISALKLGVVKTIQGFCFSECASLSSISIAKVTTCESHAFSECPKLQYVSLIQFNTLKDRLFVGTGALPEGSCCPLRSLYLGDGFEVTEFFTKTPPSVSADAFYGCCGVTSFTYCGSTNINHEQTADLGFMSSLSHVTVVDKTIKFITGKPLRYDCDDVCNSGTDFKDDPDCLLPTDHFTENHGTYSLRQRSLFFIQIARFVDFYEL